jgi:carboxymethylenebutenolidase
MPGTKVTLHVSDGTSMNAYLASADQPKAGIIVFQEAFGVNAHIRDIADRFAREGYTAIAPELFHRTAPGFEASYTDYPKVQPHMQALTPEGLEADAKAAFDYLDTAAGMKGSIVSIGFCMGGRVSFIANSIVPLKAAVSFYGGGIVPDHLHRAASLHAPMLFFWGGKDTHISRETWSQIPAALDTAGKEHVTTEFGAADHGFFCDVRASYHKPSAEIAWPMVLAFLGQKLAP